MNKKTAKVMVISLLLSLLTGCFPTGELEQSSPSSVNTANDGAEPDVSDNSAASEPAAFTVPNDLKNVKFNFEPSGDYPSEVPVIKANKRIFDVEEAKAVFIDGKTVIKETPNDYGGAFHTSDGITLSVNQGRLTYAVNHLFDDEEKHDLYGVQSAAAKNLRYFYLDYQYLDSELEGFSRSEALERAEELVSKLDIKFLGEPSVYAFTIEDIEYYYNNHSFDREGDEMDVRLTKEDEFYLVRYYGEFSGITTPGEIGRVFEKEFQENTQVDVILTKDSLVKLSCDNVFDDIEAVDTTQIKCGIDAAISKAHDYYSVKDNVMDYQLEYDSIGISYVTFANDYSAGEVIFKPLWHLSGTQFYTNPDGSVGTMYADKFVDPVTGMVYDAGL